MNQINLLSRAREFAQKHHEDISFDTGSGYKRHQLNHLQEVVDLVWASGGSELEQAAAWLHDTVEDTPIKLNGIERLCGKEVAEIVHGLTDMNISWRRAGSACSYFAPSSALSSRQTEFMQ